jgi:tRNA(Arg) A34 adenosine deaminase TadA
MRSHLEWTNILIKMLQDMPRTELSHRSRLASAVVYRGSLVSFGFNSLKTHPLQAKYSKNPWSIHLHSEIDAIKNSLRHIDQRELSKSTLYVARVKQEQFTMRSIQGLAKPCPGCARAIATFDIRQVIWTLDEQGLSCDEEVA